MCVIREGIDKAFGIFFREMAGTNHKISSHSFYLSPASIPSLYPLAVIGNEGYIPRSFPRFLVSYDVAKGRRYMKEETKGRVSPTDRTGRYMKIKR